MSQVVNRAVRYEVEGQPFEGRLVFDLSSQSARPGLLMAPNWMGISAGAIEMAEQVAGRGYVVLIADLYGADVRPQSGQEAGAAMAEVKDTPALRQRMQMALAALQDQPDTPLDPSRIATFGFCFGGHCALELARSGAPVQASISFHGTLNTASSADAQNIQGAVLVLDGAADPLVPREQLGEFVAEMLLTNVDWQLTSFAGAVHSFTDPLANTPGRMQYDANVSRRAFAAMYELLDEVFA